MVAVGMKLSRQIFFIPSELENIFPSANNIIRLRFTLLTFKPRSSLPPRIFNLSMVLKHLFLLVTLIWFLHLPWNIADAKSEQDKINQLLHQMERAYVNRDIDDYMSVFHDEFEYQSDVGTPEDASDDISGITKELERESALRVFEQFYTMEIDLLSGLEISVTGDKATAKSAYTIVGETFDPENWTLYMRGTNTFSLLKPQAEGASSSFSSASEQWQIIRWQDNALSTNAREDTKSINEPRTVDNLISALGGELKVWAPAMLILEEQVDAEAVADKLFNIVRQGQKAKMRARAARLLGRVKLNEAKILALAHLCANPRTDVVLRIGILSALSAQRDQIAAETIKKSAMDGHPEVRAFATLQLSRLKTADAKEYLMEALNDSATNVRRAAVEAILRDNSLPYHDKLSNSLQQLIQTPSEALTTRKVALRALVKYIGLNTRSMVTEILTDTSLPDALRTEAAHILEENPPMDEAKKVEDNLLTIYHNSNESEMLRAAAISALSRYASEQSTIPLIKALSSPSKRFKARACSTLGLIGAHNAIEPILKLALDKKEHIHVRRAAVEALWMLEADDTIPSMAQLLTDKSELGNFRGAITMALGKWQNERALTALLNIIESKDEPWWLRGAAVRSLKNAPEPRIMTILNELLDADDDRLRQAAADKLKNLESTRG
jgi:HEAT repeat protein